MLVLARQYGDFCGTISPLVVPKVSSVVLGGQDHVTGVLVESFSPTGLEGTCSHLLYSPAKLVLARQSVGSGGVRSTLMVPMVPCVVLGGQYHVTGVPVGQFPPAGLEGPRTGVD